MKFVGSQIIWIVREAVPGYNPRSQKRDLGAPECGRQSSVRPTEAYAPKARLPGWQILLGVGLYRDFDVRRDFTVQLDRDMELAELLERLFE